MAASVLPHPGEPQIKVVRPRGSPPPVIASSPEIPVAHLGSPRLAFFLVGLFVMDRQLYRIARGDHGEMQ
jgi:hypothetical protein